MEIQVREPRTDKEFEQYYNLRWRVLREPWTQARESEKDEHEQEAIHLTAWRGDQLLGAGRVHFNSPEQAQIRYMAVDPDHCAQGIGSQILQGLEERASKAGAKSVVLNARENALPFYRKHGYRLLDQSGTLFDSIVHWSMEKDL